MNETQGIVSGNDIYLHVKVGPTNFNSGCNYKPIEIERTLEVSLNLKVWQKETFNEE